MPTTVTCRILPLLVLGALAACTKSTPNEHQEPPRAVNTATATSNATNVPSVPSGASPAISWPAEPSPPWGAEGAIAESALAELQKNKRYSTLWTGSAKNRAETLTQVSVSLAALGSEFASDKFSALATA